MLRPEQERVKQLLTEAITLLCRNSLRFEEEVSVEGLLGITLDRSDIFLVSIRETVRNTLKEATASVRAEKNKDHDNVGSPTSAKRRRLMEKRRDGEESPPPSPSGQDQKGAERLTDNGKLGREDSSDSVRVKQEKTTDGTDSNTDWQTNDDEDGRKYNPAFDSTAKKSSSEHSSDPPQTKRNLDFGSDSAKPSTSATPADSDLANVKIKEEQQDEEDECYLIESDSENSDTSRSSHFPQDSSMMGQDNSLMGQWATGDGSNTSFNLQELDMLAAQQFQQQVRFTYRKTPIWYRI